MIRPFDNSLQQWLRRPVEHKEEAQSYLTSLSVPTRYVTIMFPLLTYSFEDFIERYLLGMKRFFDISVLKKCRNVLEVLIKDGKTAECKVVSHSGSLFSK